MGPLKIHDFFCIKNKIQIFLLVTSSFGQVLPTNVLIKYLFIALIHPIQWTIAYPVGADRPAKRQKKTSCVSTGRSVPSTSALARWRVVLPSCLDRVMS